MGSRMEDRFMVRAEEEMPTVDDIGNGNKLKRKFDSQTVGNYIEIPGIASAIENENESSSSKFPKLMIDVRVRRSLSTDEELYSPNSQAMSRRESFMTMPELRTVIFHHDDCLKHRPSNTHQEAPERLSAIFRQLFNQNSDEFLSESVHIRNDVPCATRTMLEYAHDTSYVDFVYDLHRKVRHSESGKPIPFTPRVQQMQQKTKTLKEDNRCDTFFSSYTLKAALRSAGAVTKAIDSVMSGKYRNAFVAVRPPGHHAGLQGLLHNASSCGFCIFNNVAIGAKYALEEYPKIIERVAIVDFDVHHGNGTEEIVTEKFCDPEHIMFASIHLYDSNAHTTTNKKNRYEFYPGSGKEDIPEKNVLNVPIAPLWRKPRRSKRGISALSTSTNPDLLDQDGEDKMGAKGFRKQFSEKIIPALGKFKPNLILISAGFDSGKNDIGCCKWEAGANCSGMDLTPEDYKWVTLQLTTIAQLCEGKIVSVLEGGYGQYSRLGKKITISRESLAKNVCAHIHALTI